MPSRKLNLIFAWIVLPISLSGTELIFYPDSLRKSEAGYHFYYPGAKELVVNDSLSIPIITYYWERQNGLAESSLIVEVDSLLKFEKIPLERLGFDNSITSIEQATSSSQNRKRDVSKNILDIQNLSSGGQQLKSLTILPLTIDSAGNLTMASRILIPDMYDKPLSATQAISVFTINNDRNQFSEPAKNSKNFALPLGQEYLIITNETLAEEYEKLAQFKNGVGISASVALTDSITAVYGGADDAEKMRNYIIDFYQAGGKYLLLGGDQTVIPARYLVYYNTSVLPSNKYEMLPSDLYYADLNGDWDKDGDGIWGEPNQDAPDIIPEILVGRIPLKNPISVRRYINKLLRYHTAPGGGDYEYLNRHLFFSSDEMRDYPEIGQHGVIVQALPSDIITDTSWAVESPSGGDPNPVNPDGHGSVERLADGFGVINIIAHGRVDGFVVKSANYLGRPASYILTAPQTGGNGSVIDLEPNDRTSFYYSLSCNVGGYDLDTLLGDSVDYSLVETLLATDSTGAIGMVANTRWGWVYSSYLLQASFMEHLFDDAENSPARAMYYSWLEHTYLRDIIYGQNYYGDPSLKIYRSAPKDIEIDIVRIAEERYEILLGSEGNAVPGANITVSDSGVILEQGISDVAGRWEFNYPLEFEKVYLISATKDCFTVAIRNYSPSIAADVDDTKDEILPHQFVLSQNFPNPFNPATRISYSLPRRARVLFSVYNLLGETVFSTDIISQPAGEHYIDWNGESMQGGPLPSGIYLYHLKTGDFQATRKMVLLK